MLTLFNIGVTLLVLILSALLLNIMSWFSGNQFKVDGKFIVLTGGSQGMGKALARLLAEKGASVVIVARTETKLKEACEYISQGAARSTQKISYISANLTDAADCSRVISESTALNGGNPPDIVWCVAGSAMPTLFIDTSTEDLASQMRTNYFAAAYTAHAAIRSWIDHGRSKSATKRSEALASQKEAMPTYQLVFTSSLVAFYSLAGYTPYTPAKTALRGLSDTLSQELEMYRAAGTADVRVHTVFPATILSEGYEHEEQLKCDMTKMLEEDDEGQTPEACARAALASLEQSATRELVTTTFQTRLLMCASLSGSRRAGGLAGVLDGLIGLLMVLIMPWVRWFYDRKVAAWGRAHGDSGAKTRTA